MREIMNPEWREGQAIDFNSADERVAEACRVLWGCGFITPVVSVISKDDLREVVSKHFMGRGRKRLPNGFQDPDYFCFMAFTVYALAKVWREYGGDHKVHFVVSRKEVVTDHIREFHDAMQRLLT